CACAGGCACPVLMNVHCSSPESIFLSADPRADRWKGYLSSITLYVCPASVAISLTPQHGYWKIRDERPASEIGRLRQKIQRIAGQRLRDLSLSLGNVARIFADRT